jgi:hypothetical protein
MPARLKDKERYDQANTTPLMQQPLLDDFGTLGNQDTIDRVLAGTYQCPPETPEYTQKFIHELKQPDKLNNPGSITGHMTTNQFTTSWKKMKVRTAASSFGPSFSKIVTGTANSEIADIDASLLSIATMTGVIPSNWTTAIDVMIPKKKLSRHVTKLRIIVLFHALFNMLNKQVARSAIHNASRINEIPVEAYAKKGHGAIDCGLNKILTIDIIGQLRLPAALCCNDAKQCYDRILHAIANICL